jgi:hypothetical protein
MALFIIGGTRWRSCLKHCATSRKVAGSSPDGVIGPHCGPLIEMSTRYVGLTTSPPSPADCLELREPQLIGTLGACPGLYSSTCYCVLFASWFRKRKLLVYFSQGPVVAHIWNVHEEMCTVRLRHTLVRDWYVKHTFGVWASSLAPPLMSTNCVIFFLNFAHSQFVMKMTISRVLGSLTKISRPIPVLVKFRTTVTNTNRRPLSLCISYFTPVCLIFIRTKRKALQK